MVKPRDKSAADIGNDPAGLARNKFFFKNNTKK